jgi:hypothetical protein
MHESQERGASGVGARSSRSEGGPPGAIAPERLMAYLDGELAPEERAEVEALLARHTEAQRDLVLFRHLHEDLSGIRLRTRATRSSVWDRVHRRLSRPLGWILIIGGTGAWLGYGTWMYVSSTVPTWEKLMTGAVVIGVLTLFTSVIHERYREWLADPYRDVER